jgi:predicted nucleotidyltransferase
MSDKVVDMDFQKVPPTMLRKIDSCYEKDLEKAVNILQKAGCEKIFIFGSITKGKASERSDIDIAVSGCPPAKFFHLLGMLMLELNYPIDLIDLDAADPFVEYIENTGELYQIA